MVLEMQPWHVGTLVGRRVDRAVHGRRADRAARAVLAALASVSSVPVVIGLMIVSGATSFRLDPAQFFFGLVFPYLLVVGHGLRRCPCGLLPGDRGEARARAGSYRLEEKLGEGGMGRSGAPASHAGQACAIKLIGRRSPGMGGAECRKKPSADSSARPR